jgi:hypothetical protein
VAVNSKLAEVLLVGSGGPDSSSVSGAVRSGAVSGGASPGVQTTPMHCSASGLKGSPLPLALFPPPSRLPSAEMPMAALL